MKIIFFGSDDFASRHLEGLLYSKHKVLAVVTQPDRPKGRGLKVVASPVVETAQSHNLKLFQPPQLKNKDTIAELKKYQADLFVVIAYGRILSKDVLEIPKIFSINVHGSLLPSLRGAAPIHSAIIHGEKVTGLSIIRMNEKDKNRIVEVSWPAVPEAEFAAAVKISGDDRSGLVNDLTNVIGTFNNTNIRSINVDARNGLFDGLIVMSVKDTEHLKRLVEKMRDVKGVKFAQRFEDL